MNDFSAVKCFLVVAAFFVIAAPMVFADEPSEYDILPPSSYATPPPFDNSLPSFPTASASEYETESGGEAEQPPIEIPELSLQDESVYIETPGKYSPDEDRGELPHWYEDWFANDVLDSGPILDSGSGNLSSTPTMAQDVAAIRSYIEFLLFGLLPFCVAVGIFVLFAVWFYRTFIASAFR